ncbi:MAG: DUF2804 domain-containing protein [Bdellovibrionota bacterium]
MLNDHPPATARVGRSYAYGRYRHPIANPNVRWNGLGGKFRLKEWHYSALTSDRWFVAFALVQLGYVANAFCYVVDRERPEEKREYSALSPLGKALQFAPSSVSGESLWRLGEDRIRVQYDGRWLVELDLSLQGKPLRGTFTFEPQDSLALLFELEPGRPAYTHKAAGLPASGEFRYGNETIRAEKALAAIDWTRSVARRETKWKWASFSGRAPDGRALGLNLSSDVYEGPGGVSQENAFWIEGKAHPLGSVRFELPPDPRRGAWRLQSKEIDLEFTPWGTREEHVNFGLVRSDFIQPCGIFSGHVLIGGEKIGIKNIFGVVEDHLAKW